MKKNNLLSYFSQQVNLYLDNRLNDDSSESLLNAVNEDQECKQVFNNEKNFRDFVRNNAKRPSASSDLINAIKNKCS